MGRLYRNTEEFYDADPRRRRSPEADYGVHWTEAGSDWPKFRVSYVRDTGEIYAAAMTGHGGIEGQVKVLGVVPADKVREGDIYYRTLDGILEGYGRRCAERGDLDWIRDRLSRTLPLKAGD